MFQDISIWANLHIYVLSCKPLDISVPGSNMLNDVDLMFQAVFNSWFISKVFGGIIYVVIPLLLLQCFNIFTFVFIDSVR